MKARNKLFLVCVRIGHVTLNIIVNVTEENKVCEVLRGGLNYLL